MISEKIDELDNKKDDLASMKEVVVEDIETTLRNGGVEVEHNMSTYTVYEVE